MFITHLRLTHFRNLHNPDVEFGRGLNLVVGDNGSGKTSLLEGVFFLGRGRSFRTSHLAEVITFGRAEMWGFARADGGESVSHGVGVEYRRSEGITAKIDGRKIAKLSQLARILPVLFLGGQRSLLLSGSPQARREFLDWGLFHVEPEFNGLWRRYARALSQRNAALRSNRPSSEIQLWDQELSSSAMSLAQLRSHYISGLVDFLTESAAGLAAFPVDSLQLVLDRGWPHTEREFCDVLAEELERDRKLGYTRNGPHRADWELRLNQRSARQFCSAGQQKILVCGLLLAQVRLVAARGTTPILCLDDLPAELDARHRDLLLRQLQEYGAQLFVTATDETLFGEMYCTNTTRVFHVEQGNIIPQ